MPTLLPSYTYTYTHLHCDDRILEKVREYAVIENIELQ